MSRLIAEIARAIRERMQASARDVNGANAELRSVFHGPPMEFLKPVFDDLVSTGGIEVEGSGGQQLTIPVVLVVNQLPEGVANAPVGHSGYCDVINITNIRNHPGCPRYVLLVPPSCRLNMSNSSATDSFGLAPDSNSGNATTEDWLKDRFVRALIHIALNRFTWSPDSERDEARILIERAVRAADEQDRHDVNRYHAWSVLSRLFSITGSVADFPTMVSLACGFPPMRDGSIRSDVQAKTLENIASRVEDEGFITAFEHFKLDAEDSACLALDSCRAHIQRTCEVTTLFGRAAAFHYAPFQDQSVGAPPDWWRILTVELWQDLQEDEHIPEGALILTCENCLTPQRKGVPALVLADVELTLALPDGPPGPLRAELARSGGGARNAITWQLEGDRVAEHLDSTPPAHRSPLRYSVSAPNYKKATLKLVSLQAWEPGVFMFCKTASKQTLLKPPKSRRDQIAFECSLTLGGAGRHYLDLYTSPGVALNPETSAFDAAGQPTTGLASAITRSSDHHYGLEIDANGDGYFDFTACRVESDPQTIRLYVSCEEVEPEGCRSEFERLIRLNRQRDDARTTAVVQVDRQARCADLHSWILDKRWIDCSFYPLVLATDYADAWRVPDWRDRDKTVFSRGRFIHDPRPTFAEMGVPQSLVDLRRAIAERIRGPEQDGVTEAATLGDWVTRDPEFNQLVEEYVGAYLRWLEADPDAAVWMDVAAVCSLEQDGTTLALEPEAVMLNPLHPLRIGWHSLAQAVMLRAYQKHLPCPAASILDASCVPDTLALPLRTPTGGIRRQPYFSLESSSDYWAVLWNAGRLDALPMRAGNAPFDREFGVRIGGVSSGFSESQVRRALDDVHDVLAAKPVVNVMVSSAAGQTNACNEGIVSWCRERFSAEQDGDTLGPLGARRLQVLDERRSDARPDDVEISNLGEDTGNCVRWFAGGASAIKPDLGIIAQLEASNPGPAPDEIGSPVGYGGLLRHRIRRQLHTGAGAFLIESRMGSTAAASGDGLADRLSRAMARLENLVDTRLGYTFAPSVSAIRSVLERADFAAVSSSVVDPACFLGGWLPESYLWDYELPTYSRRSGDTNGYYLLSKIKDIDAQSLRAVLGRLPACSDVPDDVVHQIILEVASRGIPTVRGLAGGDSGAAGDLGLLIASRLLQDEFRTEAAESSLLPILVQLGVNTQQLVLVLPVDPFKGYLDDLQKALRASPNLRPDLLVATMLVSDSAISCRLTPIEVKYRSGQAAMSSQACSDALGQARSLGALLEALRQRASEPDLIMWQLALQHLLVSMLSYAFRVYSQRRVAANHSKEWTQLHARCVEAIFAGTLNLQVDQRGRLIVVDGSGMSAPRDHDADGFNESIVLSMADAASIVRDTSSPIYAEVRARVSSWELLPEGDYPVPRGAPGDGARAQQPAPLFVREKQSSTTTAPDAAPQSGTSAPPAEPACESEGPASIDGPESEGTTEVQELVPPAPAPTPMPTPASSAGVSLAVGQTVDGFRKEPRLLRLSDTDLTQLNVGVVGDLGTGKTQLLKAVIYGTMTSAAQNQGVRPRFLIFDYKRDYSAPEFVQSIGARVVPPHRLPMNLFDVSQANNVMSPWLERFKFFSDLLDKIYPGVGPVQRNQLKQAVRQAYDQCAEAHRQPTIYDIHANYRTALGTRSDSVLAIIDDLVDMEVFARDVEQGSHFEHFLDGAVVIDLSVVGQDDRSKNLIVAVMLNLFYEHMLRLPKRPYVGTSPQLRVLDSFLLVDEADSIMRYEFDVLRKLLLQGREFGVGVILASQYLSHFKTGPTDYREPLLTWFIHKVPNITPQELGSLGLHADLPQLAERIKTLQKHECLYKSFGTSGEIIRGFPFYELRSRDED